MFTQVNFKGLELTYIYVGNFLINTKLNYTPNINILLNFDIPTLSLSSPSRLSLSNFAVFTEQTPLCEECCDSRHPRKGKFASHNICPISSLKPKAIIPRYFNTTIVIYLTWHHPVRNSYLPIAKLYLHSMRIHICIWLFKICKC